MIRAFFSALFYGGAFLLAVYLVTGVPLGKRTLAQHVVRIFETPEAHDLGQDVVRAGKRLEHGVRHGVDEATRGE